MVARAVVMFKAAAQYVGEGGNTPVRMSRFASGRLGELALESSWIEMVEKNEWADGGYHACDYLLASDMEMDPVPGYRFTSWETGYGDFHCVPDFSTARLAAWLPGGMYLPR